MHINFNSGILCFMGYNIFFGRNVCVVGCGFDADFVSEDFIDATQSPNARRPYSLFIQINRRFECPKHVPDINHIFKAFSATVWKPSNIYIGLQSILFQHFISTRKDELIHILNMVKACLDGTYFIIEHWGLVVSAFES